MITCYPIVCLGRDVALGVEEACRLGYKVVPFAGVWAERGGYYDGLKESAIKLLRETPVGKGGEKVMLNEADFCPHMRAEELEKAISLAPEDWQLLSFAPEVKFQKEEEVKGTEGLEWSFRQRIVGCQAIMFRNSEVVEKVIDVWEKHPREGIDAATTYLDIPRYVPNKYLITQKDLKKQEVCRDKRFLVCMMSYRRIKDAVRQIYTFMDQSYDNFILQVLLHGISEEDWRGNFEPNLRHFMREGRLVVQVRPNVNQLGNVVQFGDGVNPDAYDLMVKIDDDDWYDRDFLLRLNRVHQSFPPEVGSWRGTVNGFYRQELGFPVASGGVVGSFGGNQLVIPKFTIEVMREYYRRGCDPQVLLRVIEEDEARKNWMWREDNLIVRVMRRTGMIDRGYLDGGGPGLMVTSTGPSVLRGGGFYTGQRTELLSYREPGGRRKRVLIRGKGAITLDDARREVHILEYKEGEHIILRHEGEKEVHVVKRRKGGDGWWEER